MLNSLSAYINYLDHDFQALTHSWLNRLEGSRISNKGTMVLARALQSPNCNVTYVEWVICIWAIRHWCRTDADDTVSLKTKLAMKVQRHLRMHYRFQLVQLRMYSGFMWMNHRERTDAVSVSMRIILAVKVQSPLRVHCTVQLVKWLN